MRHVTAVVGATGLLGSTVCQKLAEAGRSTRALVRPQSDPAKVAQLERLGVELRQGDLKEPPSLEALCEGAQAVISTASCMRSRHEGDSIETVDLKGQLSLIKAARSAGVEHFIFISLPPLQGTFPLQEAKRRVEQELMWAGMPRFTILRPTFFTEIWLGPTLGWDFSSARARLYGTGRGRLNWVSLDDVARFAIGALESPRARNATLELGGEEALSQLEVIRLCEELSGRRWGLDSIPESVLREQAEVPSTPELRSLAALLLNFALGGEVDPRPAMEAIPVRPSSVRDYLQRILSPPLRPSEEAQHP